MEILWPNHTSQPRSPGPPNYFQKSAQLSQIYRPLFDPFCNGHTRGYMLYSQFQNTKEQTMNPGSRRMNFHNPISPSALLVVLKPSQVAAHLAPLTPSRS